MSERTYPYKAWILQPSFKPKEVELVKPYVGWGAHYGDETASKKVYRLDEIFPSKKKKQLKKAGGASRNRKLI
ncbi:hypothetical protein [Pseudomonas aeruginosa]|uniref:hypothetical protein n=1 Tax=Pseudomonas aeruginosa TaxID=287 RepID=UPI001495610D|nr:hypothetical protein [Pseudomonas aeruginosa]NPS81517.1 hypothetical protein [Pseudomonas aeruginosa]